MVCNANTQLLNNYFLKKKNCLTLNRTNQAASAERLAKKKMKKFPSKKTEPSCEFISLHYTISFPYLSTIFFPSSSSQMILTFWRSISHHRKILFGRVCVTQNLPSSGTFSRSNLSIALQ